MSNPFDQITARLDALAMDVRALKSRTMNDKHADEIGGLSMALEITGLTAKTMYKLTHLRAIPHSRVRGRLYFRRSELEAWIDAGRRKTSAEVAEERMEGTNKKAQRA